MSLGMMAFMVVALIDTIKGKFVIDQDKVFTVSTFASRQLMFDEIKGYRITDQYKRLDKNDEVNIYFMKGYFDIPWFEVTE